jgi:hypothetical protein
MAQRQTMRDNALMKLSRVLHHSLLLCGLFTTTVTYAELSPSLNGSGNDATLEMLPSAYWPQYVTTTANIMPDSAPFKEIPQQNRGTLIRIEADTLLVDFGRYGVHAISPQNTDFHQRLGELLSGQSEKEFANFTLQVGNKLMDFGRGKESGAIRFKHIKDTELYVLIYLDTYTPEMAAPLIDFGKAYGDLTQQYPSIRFVLMPKDREFYNFGYTVGYSVPFIAPHMRVGYTNSLSHNPTTFPYIVLVDPNGKTLYQTGSELDTLIEHVQIALNQIGINWEAPRIGKRPRARAATWLP